MPLEPGVPASTPAQILLENALQRALVGARELERGGEHDVTAVMKNGVVIAELHVVGPDGLALALLGEDVARLEHFRDEHRSFAFGRGREKMQVLPDRAANSARNAHVVLEARPALRY